MTPTIAVVEDNDVQLSNYADLLRSYHFNVDTYATKESALQGLRRKPPEMVLLDLNLQNERDAGFEICAEVRQRTPQVPIVFVTAYDSEVERITGLRLGADDYISKDMSLDFLIVRIETLFRRCHAYQVGVPASSGGKTLQRAAVELRLDTEASTATWSGMHLSLTLTQFWMLTDLYTNPGIARSHEDLMRAGKIVVEPNTVAAHVKAIRDEFRRTDPTFDRIATERGRGYRWRYRSL